MCRVVLMVHGADMANNVYMQRDRSVFVELDSIRGLDSMALEKEKLQPRDDVRAARRRG